MNLEKFIKTKSVKLDSTNFIESKYNLIIILLTKLNYNQHCSSIYYDNETHKIILDFINTTLTDSYQISLDFDPISQLNIIFDLDYIQFTFNQNITKSKLNQFNKYYDVYNYKNEDIVQKCTSKIKLNLYNKTWEQNDKIINDFNKTITKFKNLELSTKYGYFQWLMESLQTNVSKKKINSISQISKLNNKLDFINQKINNEIDPLLDIIIINTNIILKMMTNQYQTIKNTFFKFQITKNSIVISMLNNTIFTCEHKYINRYYFIKHEGLEFMNDFICYNNLLPKISELFQKHIFKKIV